MRDMLGAILGMALVGVVMIGLVGLGSMITQDEVKALSPVDRWIQVDGEFFRFRVNDHTPDSVPEVALRGGTVLEVFVFDENAPRGQEGFESLTDPRLIRLNQHRVVTHADTNLRGLAQFQGTSPSTRTGPDTRPIHEYFIGEFIN